MDANDLKHLLTALQAGDLSIEEGLDRLKELPFEDVGIAKIDHHRALRQGVPEVVLGEAKTTKQLEIIVQRMAAHGDNVLVTRIAGEKAKTLPGMSLNLRDGSEWGVNITASGLSNEHSTALCRSILRMRSSKPCPRCFRFRWCWDWWKRNSSPFQVASSSP